jgi:hypothetical protein
MNTDVDVDRIKRLVRADAVSYDADAFHLMVERSLDLEDVKRAVSTSRLDGLLRDERGRPLFSLSGFDMNEEPLFVLCRMSKSKVLILDVARAPGTSGAGA